MKICLISSLYDPYIVGGAEIVTKNIAESLKKKGHDVFVISSSPGLLGGIEKDEIKGVRIYRFYPLNLYWSYNCDKIPVILKPFWHLIDIWNFHVFFVVRNILIREKPDIVNTHNIAGLSASVWTAAKSLGIPVMHTVHDYALICSRTTLLNNRQQICKKVCFPCSLFSAFKKKFEGQIDFVVSPSEFALNEHITKSFFSRHKKAVVRNGYDPEPDRSTEANKPNKEILFLGQIAKHKGVDLLADVFLNLELKDVVLHIVGKGELLEGLKLKCRGNKNIIFHGFITREEKKLLFSRCRAVIVPSLWYENSPMVIYEAYAYGIPVIGSKLGGIPELIDEGMTGFIFDPFEPGELNDLIKKVSDDPDLFEKMRENCLKKSQQLTDEEQAVKYLSIFTILGKTSGKT